MRIPIFRWALALGLLALLASPFMVVAARTMFMQASFNSTQTERGVSVIISGRIFESNNASIANAAISIQVNNPQGTSVHVAIAYTDMEGVFQDRFLIPVDSPAGNYTAFLAADKPGFDTVRNVLSFAYSTPDFSIKPSAGTLSLRQGQSGTLTVTLLSLRGFNKPVNLTVLDLPPRVTIQFSPASVIPSGTATVNIAVSNLAPAGNYTVTLLAVSGSLSHGATFQLTVLSGPFQANYLLLGAAIVVIVVVALLLRSRSRRHQREDAIQELMTQAETDTGYIATARVIARLEELRAMRKVDEGTYQRLRKEYEKRLQKSK